MRITSTNTAEALRNLREISDSAREFFNEMMMTMAVIISRRTSGASPAERQAAINKRKKIVSTALYRLNSDLAKANMPPITMDLNDIVRGWDKESATVTDLR